MIYHPFAVEKMRGVRTRWEIVVLQEEKDAVTTLALKNNWDEEKLDHEMLELKDKRASVVPNLGNLWLGPWARELIKQGANIAELNLDPRAKLSPNNELSAVEDLYLPAYMNAYYVPHSKRSTAQKEALWKVRRYIKEKRITPTQRDTLLLDFLRRLEDFRTNNRPGDESRNDPVPFQFLLHQRQWFPTTDTQDQRIVRISDFVDDMSRFINEARDWGLDHWIAGVRLGEHKNNKMSDFLPLLVDLAKRINNRTDGWLRSRMFLANGGDLGMEYADIHKVNDAEFDFFQEIAGQTRAFAFGYKLMKNYMGREMAATKNLATGKLLNPNLKDDWKTYLNQLGFEDLRYFINQHRRPDPNDPNPSTYPDHAHVVFVGDSSDSIYTLTDGTGGDKPALAAMRELFTEAKGPAGAYADGWNGRLFCLHSTNLEGVNDDGVGDKGFTLYRADAPGGDVAVEHPNTISRWDRWPVSS